jgi:ankyrin repeat protein
VQFLLKEGADVHAIDRYGNNPLHESISHNHIAVAELLGRAGAELNYKSPAEHMTKCAGSGDLDKLQTLISYGVDVNCSDKDGRSSLHLVSSEGNLNVVEFLLAHEANPNARDRWGHTPLDGAVEKGHDLVAAALFARGGQMNMKSAKSLFMKSARSGDLGTLKLLIENGIDVNVTDYDQCSALHVAAMADQPVAVDFLLSNKCDVNPLSRWQTTPLDEAVKSQSLLSAKLLLALGGETLEEHVEQDIDVMRSSTLTLTDVRLAISNEASLQSERRRDMHKVKQLHTKLVDDLDESNRIFSQQISDQGQIISKISNTRLSMELPSFKPGDLEFKNLYITLPGFEADTRHVDRAFEDCASNDGDRASLSSKDDLMDSGSDDRHSDNIGGKRGASKTTGFAMMRFLEQNKGKAASTSQAEEEGLNSKFQFQTFNQVMLCLPKVEDGLLYFLKCFRKRSSRRSEAGNLLVKPLELRDCLQLCGLKNIDEESVNKFAREVHDYDFVSERDDFDLSSELELTFAQVLGSEFIVDLFAPNTYAPNYNEDKCRKIVGKSEREDKVHDAFRIIKATFNLFDTDGDGEITPEEIQNQKAVIGDLTYGNEFFRR